jgi:hypothetical protein
MEIMNLIIDSSQYTGPFFMAGIILSNCDTARDIRKKGTVEDLPLLPFLSMFVNCTLWTLYGLLKNDFSLIVRIFFLTM